MDVTLCHFLNVEFYLNNPITHIVVSLVEFITSPFRDDLTLYRFDGINLNISTFKDDLDVVTYWGLISNCF